jgi:aminoglycoside phosphotransferase
MPTKKKSGKKSGVQHGQAIKLGAGIAAGIAGALAGAYLLYERTQPQQKKAKAWVVKARKAAGSEAKRLTRIGETEYQRIVEKAIKHYGALERVGAPEIASAISDAKAEWKHIQATAKEAAKPIVRRATAKRMTKKTATRTPKRTARRK